MKKIVLFSKGKKNNFVDLNEKTRRGEKKGGGLRFLAGCTQGGKGVIQMHTVCNRGGGVGGSKIRNNAYVINGRPGVTTARPILLSARRSASRLTRAHSVKYID